uniref:Uncharacterized protein n=1 Tax=Timema tahoe TaxID=61484 RepID=A0A7R9ICJ1_9NEOP|nr:unnamed protein product [Timema tahoe]
MTGLHSPRIQSTDIVTNQHGRRYPRFVCIHPTGNTFTRSSVLADTIAPSLLLTTAKIPSGISIVVIEFLPRGGVVGCCVSSVLCILSAVYPQCCVSSVLCILSAIYPQCCVSLVLCILSAMYPQCCVSSVLCVLSDVCPQCCVSSVLCVLSAMYPQCYVSSVLLLCVLSAIYPQCYVSSVLCVLSAVCPQCYISSVLRILKLCILIVVPSGEVVSLDEVGIPIEVVRIKNVVRYRDAGSHACGCGRSKEPSSQINIIYNITVCTGGHATRDVSLVFPGDIVSQVRYMSANNVFQSLRRDKCLQTVSQAQYMSANIVSQARCRSANFCTGYLEWILSLSANQMNWYRGTLETQQQFTPSSTGGLWKHSNSSLRLIPGGLWKHSNSSLRLIPGGLWKHSNSSLRLVSGDSGNTATSTKTSPSRDQYQAVPQEKEPWRPRGLRKKRGVDLSHKSQQLKHSLCHHEEDPVSRHSLGNRPHLSQGELNPFKHAVSDQFLTVTQILSVCTRTPRSIGHWLGYASSCLAPELNLFAVNNCSLTPSLVVTVVGGFTGDRRVMIWELCDRVFISKCVVRNCSL